MYDWTWKRFEELTLDELYEMLKIRQQVFTVEQNCAYQDVDELDKVSWHLFALKQGSGTVTEIQAYLRIVDPGFKYLEPSIGRVLTTLEARGKGIGKQLLNKAIEFSDVEFPGLSIRISAQQHLEKFYREFGFEPVSAPYDEDGIPHLEMLTS
ncbi:GNAT family N-acetyltransferase [Aestuariicella hydrocarbonica]|uniref:GNAT family N-acetyltransferase n=1 Tax=Pseudomaricurvus hydrocarbonicus TaxID=1470433 RepID=A0A9E5T2G7_9GAMM|nr:GNAT family N-acetyltransferase [Aestuariicella hydrocarbonica]NHO67816.1 GNAT family N-acetyltransferase [Aestuariicella hydrocarbonica]